MANGIDELCHPDGEDIGSCSGSESALVDGGKCLLPNPDLPEYCETDLVASSFLLFHLFWVFFCCRFSLLLAFFPIKTMLDQTLVCKTLTGVVWKFDSMTL